MYGQLMGLGGTILPELGCLEVTYAGNRMLIPLSSIHYLEMND